MKMKYWSEFDKYIVMVHGKGNTPKGVLLGLSLSTYSRKYSFGSKLYDIISQENDPKCCANLIE